MSDKANAILPRFTPSQTDFLCRLKAAGLPRKMIVEMFLREHPHYSEIALEKGLSEEELLKNISKRVTSLGRSDRQSSQVISDYREQRTQCVVERSLSILSYYVPYASFDDIQELLKGVREKSRLDELSEIEHLKAVKMFVSIHASYQNSLYKRLKAERDIIKVQESGYDKSSSVSDRLELEDTEDTSIVGEPAGRSMGESDVTS